MAVIEHYLNTYAEPLARELGAALGSLGRPPWQHALVVPAFDEPWDFAASLAQRAFWPGRRTLAIVVVNQPRELGPVTAQNRALLNWFAQWPARYHGQTACLYEPEPDGSAWLVIDACGDLAPLRAQGVGLARKLGCDVAVALFHAGLLESHWLGSSDADARLPDDYFDCPKPAGAVALTYNFHHYHPDPQSPLLQATRHYERALEYYRQSLAWAGSDYAFTALGSALGLAIPAYCHVRGFPKRAGGEDFYLLNKLAKLGDVARAAPEVALLARRSPRVPFGTGPATRTIEALILEGRPWTYYNPQCFVELKAWLASRAQLWPNLTLPANLPSSTQQALTHLGVSALLKHLRQISTPVRAATAFRDWFDGFRTLKFIHYLQRHHHPALPLEQCLEQAVYR